MRPSQVALLLHSVREDHSGPYLEALEARDVPVLCLSDVRPIGDRATESAFAQVLHYFRQNQDEMRRIVETEVDVSLEKNDCILTGKVEAGRHFDDTVRHIRAGEFAVATPPDAAICRECDLRTLCRAEGIIRGLGASKAPTSSSSSTPTASR